MTLQLAKVEDEYKKFPQLKQEEVLKLQEWVKRQPHLPNITELETLIFLQSCYYSMEAAKTCVDTYYTVRTHCPEFFEERDVHGAGVNAAMDIILYSPLPGLTPEGYKVIYCKMLDSDASKFMFSDVLKIFLMTLDLWLAEEGTAEGHVIVMDLNGVVFGHLARLGVMTLKKYMFYLQEALPVRLKGLHFINTVSFMDKILGLMRPFMKKELMDVLTLHSNLDTFCKYVPEEMLPKECGGKSPSFVELRDSYYKHVRQNPDFFTDDEKNRRVNEKLRPGKPKGAGDLFGIEGNFKKLDLD